MDEMTEKSINKTEAGMAKDDDLFEAMKERAKALYDKAKGLESSALVACLEAGQALCELKEAAQHGDFMPLVKDMGIGHRRGQRYMSAYKFAVSIGMDIANPPVGVVLNDLIYERIDRDSSSGKFVKGCSGGPGRGHKAPPKDPEAEPKQYIYAIINPLIAGWVKVGMSDNPRRRLKDMQTYSPADYELVFKAELPGGLKDTTIHPWLSARFNNSREWFECSVDEAIAIIESLLDHIPGRLSAA